MINMRQGIVVEYHPEDYSADLVMVDDGSRLIGVRVMAAHGDSRSGRVDMADVVPAGDKWDITQDADHVTRAIVGYVGHNPIIVGFMEPPSSQMLLKDPKRSLYRHQSDVVETIDGEGNIDLQHPSGLFIKIGTTPTKTPLAPLAFNENLKIDRNTDTRPFVRVSLAGQTVVLTMTPDGDVNLDLDGTLTVNAGQDVFVNAADRVEVNSGDNTTINAGSNAQVNTSHDVDVKAGGNASVKSSGWSQIVSDGPGLIKSSTRLKLIGPSRSITL